MFKRILNITIFVFLIIGYQLCFAANFLSNSTYEICFTPGDDCARKIIDKISEAKKEILVQAYNFNDMAIAKSLVLAKARGVDVKMILDKSQLNPKHNLIHYFIDNKISPLIEEEIPLAHNKIIILDRHTVIGGSYNYTYAARNKNAENVVIINDSSFVEKYVRYWFMRQSKSKKINNYNQIKPKVIYVKNNSSTAR